MVRTITRCPATGVQGARRHAVSSFAVKTLNIIGPGKVGRTLGLLFARGGAFLVGDVYSRDPRHGRSALAFVGGGRAVQNIADMGKADVWLIATPDDRIAASCNTLADASRLRPGDVVFHCSGALAAADLGAAIALGAWAASVHPLKSFADAATASTTFAGTYCIAEGARPALDVLEPAFAHIGARLITIAPEAKPLYHAASALVCNDLTALMEAGLRCYEQAGIPREQALLMMAPLVRDTVDNVLEHGPMKALTGPVVRGDVATVTLHLRELAGVDPRIVTIYRELSLLAAELARARGQLDAAVLEQMTDLLKGANS